MKPQNKYLIIVFIIILLFCIFKPSRHNSVELPKTITDTIYKIDTFMYEKPVPKDSFIRDTFFLPIIIDKDSLAKDSIKGNDTIYAKLPIEEKIYEDSTYYVRISGFKPVLDEIRVYPKETIITKTEFVREQKNWLDEHLYYGIGIGFGYGMFNKKPDIFIGATIGFKF